MTGSPCSRCIAGDSALGSHPEHRSVVDDQRMDIIGYQSVRRSQMPHDSVPLYVEHAVAQGGYPHTSVGIFAEVTDVTIVHLFLRQHMDISGRVCNQLVSAEGVEPAFSPCPQTSVPILRQDTETVCLCEEMAEAVLRKQVQRSIVVRHPQPSFGVFMQIHHIIGGDRGRITGFVHIDGTAWAMQTSLACAHPLLPIARKEGCVYVLAIQLRVRTKRQCSRVQQHGISYCVADKDFRSHGAKRSHTVGSKRGCILLYQEVGHIGLRRSNHLHTVRIVANENIAILIHRHGEEKIRSEQSAPAVNTALLLRRMVI